MHIPTSTPAQTPSSASTSESCADFRAFPDWTRMSGHYATFHDFQRERPVAAWRLDEAQYRLGLYLRPTQATGM